MRKALGVILLVVGIACIGLPLLTFFSVGCSACKPTTAEAETITNPDDDGSFSVYLANPLSYTQTVITPYSQTFLIMTDFELVVNTNSNGDIISLTYRTYNNTSYNLSFNQTVYNVDLPVALTTGSGTATAAFLIYIFDYNSAIANVENLTQIITRYADGAMWYDFKSGSSTIFTLCVSSIGSTSNIVYNVFAPFNSSTSANIAIYDFFDYRGEFSEEYNRGYANGERKGYQDGLDVTIREINPIRFAIDAADGFFEISPFGNGVTFGTILSVGFGCVLLGLCIKIFLGG